MPDAFINGIWAAVHTPFRDDLSLDLDGIAANASHYAKQLGLAGIFCNGGMGEYTALTRGERRDALVAHIAGGGEGWRVGVVVNDDSLAGAIELARHAGQAGADHVVLLRPVGDMADEDLVNYVERVVQASGTPAVLFDRLRAPGGWPRHVILRLARSGTVRAVKCTRDPDANAELRTACGAEILVTNPFESQCLTVLARFGLNALYADPEPYLFQRADTRPIADYHRAWFAGQLGQSAAIFRSLEPLRAVYESWVIGPLRNGAPVNAALKRWSKRMGLAAGPVRPPLKPLSAEEAARLDAELDLAFAKVQAG